MTINKCIPLEVGGKDKKNQLQPVLQKVKNKRGISTDSISKNLNSKLKQIYQRNKMKNLDEDDFAQVSFDSRFKLSQQSPEIKPTKPKVSFKGPGGSGSLVIESMDSDFDNEVIYFLTTID